ncbi:Dehydrogenase/reductase SDR member 11 [Homalodisca vitripennis]|nr:Dehydrogenase/reductase SDR member 11 [Homalodisca vitripennis]
MDQWKGKVAIVTGASAGIGAAIAQALVHHGMVVVGLARRQDKMEELAAQLTQANEPGKFHPVKCDLKQEEEILAAFDWVEKELGGADVLVNNAGTSDLNTIQGGVTEQWRNMFHLNLLAVCICTREYLKSMDKRKNQQGHIFVINRSNPSCLITNLTVLQGTNYSEATKAIIECTQHQIDPILPLSHHKSDGITGHELLGGH